MPDLDRMVAGLRCRDVLADLSDFLDGLLAEERVIAVKAHLAECETCARFGAEVAAVLAALRAGHAAATPPLGDDALARLRARVADAITTNPDPG
jgi:anti-sigma factor RsiW